LRRHTQRRAEQRSASAQRCWALRSSAAPARAGPALRRHTQRRAEQRSACAAGPYVLLPRPGRQGKDQRRRQDEESEHFGESHGHLARLSETEKKLWGDSTPNVKNCYLRRRLGSGAVLRRGGFTPPCGEVNSPLRPQTAPQPQIPRSLRLATVHESAKRFGLRRLDAALK